MKDYFQMLHTIMPLSSDRPISAITLDLAERAGRVWDGKSNSYSKPFDNELTAEWVLYFEKFFLCNLSKHPELKEYWIDIINDTFFQTMQHFDFSRLSDASLSRYVFVAFKNKLKSLFSKVGVTKVDRYSGGYFLTDKSPSELSPVSLEDYHTPDSDDLISCELLTDIEQAILGKPFGKEVLDCLLSSSRFMSLELIVRSISKSFGTLTGEQKKQIKDIYFTISHIVDIYREV